MERETFDRVVWIRAHFSGREPKIGTGFRLDTHRVLTARHAVESRATDGVMRAERIQVLPRGLPVGAENSAVFDSERSLLRLGEAQGSAETDIALLRVDHLPEITPFRKLARYVGDPRRCRFLGFPTCTQDFQNEREPWNGWCDLDLSNPDRPVVPLTFLGNPPNPKVGAPSWAGISGGPLFLSEGSSDGLLYGLVRSAPKDFGDKLFAVSIPVLMQSQAFREAIGWETVACNQELWRRGLSLLKDSRLVGFCEAFETGWNGPLLRESPESFLEDLVGRGRISDVMSYLDDMAGHSARDSDLLSTLQELGRILAGLMIERRVQLAGAGAPVSGSRMDLPTTSNRETEAAVAASEGQAPSFPISESARRPESPFRVPAPSLTGGIDNDLKIHDMLDEVSSRRLRSVERLFRHELNRSPFLYEDEVEDFRLRSSTHDIDLRARSINANLKEKRKVEGRSYYVAERPGQELQEAALRLLLDDLSERIPEMRWVAFRDDRELEVEIENELKPLWTLLSRRAGRQLEGGD